MDRAVTDKAFVLYLTYGSRTANRMDSQYQTVNGLVGNADWGESLTVVSCEFRGLNKWLNDDKYLDEAGLVRIRWPRKNTSRHCSKKKRHNVGTVQILGHLVIKATNLNHMPMKWKIDRCHLTITLIYLFYKSRSLMT